MSSTDIFKNLFKSGETERFKQLESFFTDKGLNFKTELSDDEIQSIVLLEIIQFDINEEFDIDLGISKITKLIKEIKVSRKRMGRTEAFRVLEQQGINERENRGSRSTLRKIAGF